MKSLSRAIATVGVATAVFAATPIAAATLSINGNGVLTGATGVNVNGSLFDVTFAEGTCAGLFTGCNETADFAFNSAVDALAAGNALLGQVFIDGQAGRFDSNPALTFGCSQSCQSFIPYGPANGGFFPVVGVMNGATEAADQVVTAAAGISFDTSFSAGSNYAVFKPTAITSAVPEPATWAMMILGFGVVGGAMRRRKSKVTTNVAYA